jgi:hypothetical protein
MPDHTSYGAPLFDRSPANMPPAWVRAILQDAAMRIGQRNAQEGRRLMSVGAIQDALDNLADGDTASACHAAEEAAVMRRMGE